MPARQTARITAVVIVVLLAVIAALGAGIVVALLGVSALAAVTVGGGTWVAVATVGIATVAFLFPPAPSPVLTDSPHQVVTGGNRPATVPVITRTDLRGTRW
ncbi:MULTISPECIES: hypothetical protein [Streptomyces]|uniref:Integral membrane protein n=2 Tax=Streptomyces TaxID=1883 RepID=A0ABU4KDN5_9ACTN|nr:hypothetical protein [Streptomyces roseolus]MDX2295881.1 hypothetical protein [Streptomyces roseolus]